MDQYINPFGIQQNNAVPSNPFYSGMVQQQTQQQAQPFIDMAQQSRGLSLQKQGIETGEFADPRAVRARMSGHDLTATQNESKIAMQPKIDEHERKRLSEEIRAMPGMTDAKIAQAAEVTRNARSAPHREMLMNLGQLYPMLQKASDTEKPFLYASAVERMKGLGIQVPKNFQNYDERFLPDLAALYHNQIFSPEQVGRERIVDQQGRNNLDVQALRNEGQLAVQNAHNSGSLRVAQERGAVAETPQRAEARLRRELRANPNNEEAGRELKGYLEERFDQRFQKDGLGNMLQIQASQNPEAMKKYLIYREQQKARLFMDEGIYGNLDAKARDWVLRAIEVNPNMGTENIVLEGQRLGKISKRIKK